MTLAHTTPDPSNPPRRDPDPNPAPTTAYGALAAVLMAIPQTLADTRHERGLTMQDAADQIGVSISTVHRIENGYTLTPRYTPDLLRWLDGQAVPDDETEDR